MVNKNLAYKTPQEQMHSNEHRNHGKMIEKIYGSPVFLEFVRQWGDAFLRFEYVKSHDTKLKQV